MEVGAVVRQLAAGGDCSRTAAPLLRLCSVVSRVIYFILSFIRILHCKCLRSTQGTLS